MNKTLKHLSILFFISMILYHVDANSQAFNHPGILNSKTELDNIKEKIKAGEQPWLQAFNALKTSPYATLNYTPQPFARVECGSYNNPNIGCNQFVENGIAVYCHALLFYLTDDIRYANKAIEIINAWSYVYIENTNSNARLEVSWATPWYVNGAELLRHSNSGWKSEDIMQFNSMLDKFLPYVLDETMPGNNWIQSAIEAHMAIAVFKDNRTLFNNAVDRWKFRVTTYIYQTTDGPKPINIPGKSDAQTASTWRSTASSTSYVDGSAMETCRDLGHLNLGFSSMMYAAEIAWQQGIDLFSLEEKRLTDFMELHGSWMTGTVAVPNYICTGIVKARQADSQGITTPSGGGQTPWEIAYNHLHDRLFHPLPYTWKMIQNTRPANPAKWVKKMETLSHAERRFASPDLTVTIVNPNTDYLQVSNNYQLSVEAGITITNNNFSHAIIYIDNDSVRRINQAPFEWGFNDSPNPDELNGMTTGKHTIRVVAIDLNGDKSSAFFTVEVMAPKEPYSGTAIALPGTIEAENFDTGGEGLSYHDYESENVSGAYRDEGVDIESLANVGYVVVNIYPNEWLEYTVNVATDGFYDFGFVYACRRAGGKIGAELTGEGGVLFTDLAVPLTRSLTDYRTLTKEAVWLPKGEHLLRINLIREGYNLDKIVISKTISEALNEVSAKPVTIFPNPTTGLVHISVSRKWKLLSLTGKLIQEGEGKVIDLQDKLTGIYLVKTEGEVFRVIRQ